MSQSKTSWTRLFHSPVGFVQDVPYSELLSSWLLASEKYLSLTRRTQRKDGCEVSSITKKKKKTFQKCSIVTLYAIWIGTGIIHLPFDSVYVKTLLREWPLFLRKGWAIFSELQIIFWGQVVQEYFCGNCQTLPSKNNSRSVSPVSNKLLVWKYDFLNKPPLYEPVSSLYKVYKIKYIPMFLWA